MKAALTECKEMAPNPRRGELKMSSDKLVSKQESKNSPFGGCPGVVGVVPEIVADGRHSFRVFPDVFRATPG